MTMTRYSQNGKCSAVIFCPIFDILPVDYLEIHNPPKFWGSKGREVKGHHSP